MLVSELEISDRFKRIFREAGVSELYPPQADAVDAGLLSRKNMILCTPTASGKTFAAELAMAKALEAGKKVVYVVPLRALAYEKFRDFKKYEKLGYAVKMEVGDLDSSKYKSKPKFDILVATAEKCDSILRSRQDWFSGMGLLVLDEIHLIASNRGPVYEILVSKFIHTYPDVQVLGLSATIGNANELAEWLRGVLVSSEWRPVKLKELIAVKGEEAIEDVVKAALKEGQVMVFVNSRRSCEAVAEKLGLDLKLDVDAAKLEEISEKILDALSHPTKQCQRLGECVKRGVAFHHAGLVNDQRILVEDSFKDGTIKVIVATPTLAAGVNLPSRTVILRDVKRYTDEGMVYIPVLEYKQMVGRAGRPKYDDAGVAITLAKNEGEADYIEEHYINGDVEDIHSQLGVMPVMRFHTLASIASGFTKTREALLDFLGTTFFGFQYGTTKELQGVVEEVLKQLAEWDFVKSEGRFLLATEIGNRISELYIDPLTGHNYIELFGKAEKENKFSPIALLEVLCDAVEITHLPVKANEESKIWEHAYSMEDKLLRDLGGFELDFQFVGRYKTARMFEEWISEKGEDEILEKYDVAPGQLYQRLQNLEWLAYAAAEMTRILKMRRNQVELKKLEVRIKYGVNEELVSLVSVKGIGRARARKLYNAGIRTVSELKRTDQKKLAEIVGLKTAERIREELESI